MDEPKFGAAAAPLVDIGKAKLADQPEVRTLEEVHARGVQCEGHAVFWQGLDLSEIMIR